MIIFLLSCLIGWFYFDSSTQYNQHAQESDHTHDILIKYASVAKLSLEKLIAMGEIVRTGQVQTPQLKAEKAQVLRQTLFDIRQILLHKLNDNKHISINLELQAYDQISQKVERILATNNEIKLLVAENKLSQAKKLFSLLQKQNVDTQFNLLIDKAVKQEQQQAELIRKSVNQLYHTNNKILLTALAVMSLFTLFTFWYFWRRINLSTKQLLWATQEFTAGKLNHRIAPQNDFEFQFLAKSLNNMAEQLAEQQYQLNLAKRSLEEKVQQRTYDLELSNKRFAQVDQQRRQFLADIGHELRTPLTIIRGESEVLLRSQSEEVSEYQQVLACIIDEVKHTTALIEDLMLVARSSAGQLTLQRSQFNISQLLNELFDTYQRKALEKQQQLVLNSMVTDLFIEADERRIRQVLMILLENALIYSKSRAQNEIQIHVQKEFIAIKIIDQGIGITDNEQQQIFERFYRGNRSKAKGSGLGLPVAKAIIDAHDGHITLKPNEHSTGSTATILLPWHFKEKVEI
ncbi:HAMP domain-containing protein [Pseudoalteromonas denitrificans DSM 6059]|uniref:histidine kinase n=2 Tax=Pseudoalteromonas TaxID=53246 RepID=A0A1I1MB43_9GAMM|nr:HAMP domain-containing protein [Pseudoalteromonas denitrificans DSM 6059]